MSELSAHLLVSGRVQGVGFRFTTQQKANEIGVVGWVKNNPDGRVEIEVEGDVESVYTFIDAIKAGPSPSAKVEDVDIDVSEEITGYRSFKITN
ncbi:acylphosphatase [Pelagirhabdus alkalitolerans]|uniref:Acylphosphatase n=1 Tax=Pelagirhabdus alkalitolerans TaxID=1612202 RepID=A0A1G6H8U2_9BACI|nr:acylphosphatase [Pelagirhabdus alkalitolerans]SDB90707.1 acylphosphatase [Pelagirhabdus alkalitolerans]